MYKKQCPSITKTDAYILNFFKTFMLPDEYKRMMDSTHHGWEHFKTTAKYASKIYTHLSKLPEHNCYNHQEAWLVYIAGLLHDFGLYVTFDSYNEKDIFGATNHSEMRKHHHERSAFYIKKFEVALFDLVYETINKKIFRIHSDNKAQVYRDIRHIAYLVSRHRETSNLEEKDLGVIAIQMADKCQIFDIKLTSKRSIGHTLEFSYDPKLTPEDYAQISRGHIIKKVFDRILNKYDLNLLSEGMIALNKKELLSAWLSFDTDSKLFKDLTEHTLKQAHLQYKKLYENK